MDTMGSISTSLPDDIVLEILCCLRRACSLARCRCVCKAWRAIIDAHGLLLSHALPDRAFPGFFANTGDLREPAPLFLSPPAAGAPEVDRLDFLRPHLPRGSSRATVQDHCNGLVLCLQEDAGFVCNPTTKRWARLPHPPTAWPRYHEGLYLAFDPAVSLHYQVFLIPVAPPRPKVTAGGLPDLPTTRVTLDMFIPESFGKQQEERLFKRRKQQEPPEEKVVPLLVFSSADGRWKRRVFAPGRCSPGHLYDKVMARRRRASERDPWARTWRSAAHRRGSLYVHCEKHVLVVLHCSEGTYDMVDLPGDADDTGVPYDKKHVLSALPVDSIFTSAERGVLRYARVGVSRVKIWALQEPACVGGQLEWTLTHDKDLAAHARMLVLLDLAPPNCMRRARAGRRPNEATHGDDGWPERRNSWDEAMDSMLDMEPDEEELPGEAAGTAPSSFSILGFHSSKDVAFLAAGAFHVVAYHLGSSKVQYLGRVTSQGDRHVDGVFPYSPCFIDALPLPVSRCPFPCLKTACRLQQESSLVLAHACYS